MRKAPLASSDRQKILEARCKSLGISPNRVLFGDMLDNKHKLYVPIGIVELDTSMGAIPGIACGSLIEFIGESGSGKTHTSLKHAAEYQKTGKRVAFLNIENAFYEPRANALGVITRDPDLFELWENVGSGENWGELAKSLVKSGEYGLVIIDSVTAMIPTADYDKSLGDTAMIGAHARMCGRLAQKLTELCADSDTSVILINQFRYGAGAIKGTFVKKSTGGESIGFYAHVRFAYGKINGSKGEVYNEAKELIGGRSKVLCIKNRFGQAGWSIDFPVYFGDAVSDPIIEFIMKAKAKYVELITESKKNGLRYVGNDGVVVESKNPKEFIKSLQQTDAPEKRTKGDNSVTAFDYICRQLKMNAISLAKLNEQILIEDKNIDDYEDYDSEDTKSIAELTLEEVQELLPE